MYKPSQENGAGHYTRLISVPTTTHNQINAAAITATPHMELNVNAPPQDESHCQWQISPSGGVAIGDSRRVALGTAIGWPTGAHDPVLVEYCGVIATNPLEGTSILGVLGVGTTPITANTASLNRHTLLPTNLGSSYGKAIVEEITSASYIAFGFEIINESGSSVRLEHLRLSAWIRAYTCQQSMLDPLR